MKNYLLKIALFFALLAVCDITVGYIGRYLTNHAKTGDIKQSNNIVRNVDANILLMGSSRCAHHYDPKIFEERLNETCYNIGLDGNGIILMYGRYMMMSERYTPKLIIYDAYYSFDIMNNDNHRYLQYLRPYYDDKNVKPIVNSIGDNESIKMVSQSYRYNNQLLRLIFNNIKKSTDNGMNGYIPLNYNMQYEEAADTVITSDVDPLKLYFFEDFIKKCQGNTELVICSSPRYLQVKDHSFDDIEVLCEKYDIPFLDHYSDTTFTTHKEYFADNNHLNSSGAIVFSNQISEEIKSLRKK